MSSEEAKKSAPEETLILEAVESASGIWDGLRTLVGGSCAGRPAGPAAGTFKQHPALESGRSHHRIPLEDLFLHRREVRRHQPDRLEQAGEHAGLCDRFVQEYAAIKPLVLGTHDREPEIGVKIFAR